MNFGEKAVNDRKNTATSGVLPHHALAQRLLGDFSAVWPPAVGLGSLLAEYAARSQQKLKSLLVRKSEEVVIIE